MKAQTVIVATGGLCAPRAAASTGRGQGRATLQPSSLRWLASWRPACLGTGSRRPDVCATFGALKP